MYAITYKNTGLPANDPRGDMVNCYVSHIKTYSEALDVQEEFFREMGENADELFTTNIVEHD
jgi:hypothetical protein